MLPAKPKIFTICFFTEILCQCNPRIGRKTLGIHFTNFVSNATFNMVIQSSFSFRKEPVSWKYCPCYSTVRLDCEFWIYLLYNGNQFYSLRE